MQTQVNFNKFTLIQSDMEDVDWKGTRTGRNHRDMKRSGWIKENKICLLY